MDQQYFNESFLKILWIVFFLSIIIWYRKVVLHFLQNIIAILVYPLGTKAKYSFKVLWFLRSPLVEIESLDQLIEKSPIVTRFAMYDEIAYSLESGDIVLFIGKNYNRDYVSAKWSYGSPITHIGLVIRDSHNNLSLFEATALYGVILNDLRERIESYDSDMVAIRRLKVERTQKMQEELYVLISETGGRTHDLHTLKGLIENQEGELVRNLRLGASLEDEIFILKERSDKLVV